MKHFNNITLVCIDCHNYVGAIMAIQKSLRHASFKSVKFITDLSITSSEFSTIIIDKITSKEEYSEFVIKELYKYFDTDFVWIIQHDGYILNTDVWTDEFLEYDGIGAKWLYIDGRNNFNGGFSIRSKKLQTVIANDPVIQVFHPEDSVICRLYRHYLEEAHGISFPPDELCDKFAYELNEPTGLTVGFHGYFHNPYTDCIVVRRTAALGDCIAVEPVLEYYHKKGLRVYLDTIPDFFHLFMQHRYRIEHFSNINPNMPYLLVDLDMSYENNPRQLHLKSYYEAAGISDGEIKRPQLDFPFLKDGRLFKNKYAVIHTDKRAQGGRNINGVNWHEIVADLNLKGYEVFHVGKGEHDTIFGATEMNTVTLNILQYLVAGADLFIGIDSGISHIAVAHSIPSVIFFGSVNPDYIHPDVSNILAITNHNEENPICREPYCWHSVNGCEGVECLEGEVIPRCSVFDTKRVIEKINEFICRKSN